MGTYYCDVEHYSRKFEYLLLGYNVRPNQVVSVISILSKVCKVIK